MLRGSKSSGSEEEEDDNLDQLELNSITPVTGFTVVLNKQSADFHALFPSVLDREYLIDNYGCALQHEILIQHRPYISENHICFHANIFGWTTGVSIVISLLTSSNTPSSSRRHHLPHKAHERPISSPMPSKSQPMMPNIPLLLA